MTKGNPFLALRIAEEHHEALRTRAAETGMSVTEFVRQAIALHVSRAENHPSRPKAISRTPSRPARLARAIDAITDLLTDYQQWQENLPESLRETATGAALADTVEGLEQALDALVGITPPRGFGRD